MLRKRAQVAAFFPHLAVAAVLQLCPRDPQEKNVMRNTRPTLLYDSFVSVKPGEILESTFYIIAFNTTENRERFLSFGVDANAIAIAAKHFYTTTQLMQLNSEPLQALRDGEPFCARMS